MYSLDINFLNDRPEYKPEVAARAKSSAPAVTNNQPLYLGLLAAVLLLGGTAGTWFFLQTQNDAKRALLADLDAKVGELQALQGQLEAKQKEIELSRAETQALASVFNQIKPWSAMMQDFRDRTPPGVQILQVKQEAPPAGTPQPAASPTAGAPPASAPPVFLKILGTATSFNDVNDFVLMLQRSSFLNAKKTQMITAELGEPGKITLLQGAGGGGAGSEKALELPRSVKFEIQTALNDIPASELLSEIDRKGAAGLVTRIEALQQKGVIKP